MYFNSYLNDNTKCNSSDFKSGISVSTGNHCPHFYFSAEILGEIRSFYMRFLYWDTVLHTLNGFLCAAIGFSLVDIMNRQRKMKFDLSPLFMAITAFCFSMTIGVLWEFFEFGMDFLWNLDMQKRYCYPFYTFNTSEYRRSKPIYPYYKYSGSSD